MPTKTSIGTSETTASLTSRRLITCLLWRVACGVWRVGVDSRGRPSRTGSHSRADGSATPPQQHPYTGGKKNLRGTPAFVGHLLPLRPSSQPFRLMRAANYAWASPPHHAHDDTRHGRR